MDITYLNLTFNCCEQKVNVEVGGWWTEPKRATNSTSMSTQWSMPGNRPKDVTKDHSILTREEIQVHNTTELILNFKLKQLVFRSVRSMLKLQTCHISFAGNCLWNHSRPWQESCYSSQTNHSSSSCRHKREDTWLVNVTRRGWSLWKTQLPAIVSITGINCFQWWWVESRLSLFKKKYLT